MHHDIAVIEQVCLHKLQTTKHFLLVMIFGTCSLSKAFRKDPLEYDVEEAMNSDTESEEVEHDNGTAERKEDDMPLGKEAKNSWKSLHWSFWVLQFVRRHLSPCFAKSISQNRCQLQQFIVIS